MLQNINRALETQTGIQTESWAKKMYGSLFEFPHSQVVRGATLYLCLREVLLGELR